MRVLVVNDAELAAALNRLRGEWAELEDGTLTSENVSSALVESNQAIDADVLAFPARYLGQLAWRLRPIRASVLQSELFNDEDILPLARRALTHYGGRPLTLPLAAQVPLVGYPDSWLTPGDGGAPNTWQAYHELAARTGQRPAYWPDRAVSGHWPAIMLLARAAPYACHSREESPLFDPYSMTPLVAGPPFERALKEWRLELAAAKEPAVDSDFEWAEMPGSKEAFHRSSGEWVPLLSPRSVPFVADGLLIGVTKSSRNAASAFRLATWLASGHIAPQLVEANPAMLPCRRSQIAERPGRIRDHVAGAHAAKLALPMQAALSRDEHLLVPRIPGIDQYLEALATGVDAALRGDKLPEDALRHVVEQWDQLTDKLGRDSQRRAYLAHLGLFEP